jgi:hypothetical protein
VRAYAISSDPQTAGLHALHVYFFSLAQRKIRGERNLGMTANNLIGGELR